LTTASPPPERGGELNAALARAVVRAQARFTGHGPSKAQAFFNGNVVVIVLENSMTAGEGSLVADGRADAVLALRREFHQSMRVELNGVVEGQTGRGVVASMSDSHVEPDLTMLVFMLDGPVAG
jgi:uncharacterized protein YbcI